MIIIQYTFYCYYEYSEECVIKEKCKDTENFFHPFRSWMVSRHSIKMIINYILNFYAPNSFDFFFLDGNAAFSITTKLAVFSRQSLWTFFFCSTTLKKWIKKNKNENKRRNWSFFLWFNSYSFGFFVSSSKLFAFIFKTTDFELVFMKTTSQFTDCIFRLT